MIEAYVSLHQPARDQSVASAREIEEIHAHATADDNLYEVITPHTYLTERKDRTFSDIDIVSCMRVRLGLETDARFQWNVAKNRKLHLDF